MRDILCNIPSAIEYGGRVCVKRNCTTAIRQFTDIVQSGFECLKGGIRRHDEEEDEEVRKIWVDVAATYMLESCSRRSCKYIMASVSIRLLNHVFAPQYFYAVPSSSTCMVCYYQVKRPQEKILFCACNGAFTKLLICIRRPVHYPQHPRNQAIEELCKASKMDQGMCSEQAPIRIHAAVSGEENRYRWNFYTEKICSMRF